VPGAPRPRRASFGLCGSLVMDSKRVIKKIVVRHEA